METTFLIILILIPLAGIGIGGLAIYTEHKQKMAMIERGINPAAKKEATPKERLSGSLVTLGVGAAFVIFYFLSGTLVWFLLAGLIVFFVGLGRTIAFFLPADRYAGQKGPESSSDS